ncbi:MAG: aspartate carbamoyltransferase regulatory subunit [Paramuribaculum sp.]|nr:aspartate carbamoyltransferase regulatory subunit [Paramuribaculum sp.]MDE6383261.1 aspartate carbamoyltransferase regulatory subunit [Paramuribaculum sp.]MDE6783743.1 aspartate carbamoyltransferase regulatory subunit [Paramuribaculum sp.]
MTKDYKELAVAALRSGTVIDHIPSQNLFKAVKILGIEGMDRAVTIGNNLESKRYGRKGIIKVADVEFPEQVINRIALIAPHAKINIIRDYEVAEKHPVQLPDTIVGIVKCPNPKCITNNEPMRTRFAVTEHSPEDVNLRCLYCNRTVAGSEAVIE